VLKLPVVTLNNENAPNALFAKPVVINGIALCPSLVFNTPGAGGFGTGAASALDENAKQASADRMRHSGVTFLNWRMSVFIWFFLCLFPAGCFCWLAGPEETKDRAGKSPLPDSDSFSHAESGEN
jgi:hypothetical protein